MPQDPAFYLFAIPAVLLIGLAKGGFSGLGALGMPLIALGMRSGSGRRDPAADPDRPGRGRRRRLPQELGRPGARASCCPARSSGWRSAGVRRLGLVATRCWSRSARSRSCSALYRLWAERGGRIAASSRSPAWVGSLFGVATGFTSQIAHAGGPPFQMWVMPRRLPRDVFVGTTAIFFAVAQLDQGPGLCRARPVHPRQRASPPLALLPFAIARQPRRRDGWSARSRSSASTPSSTR